MTQLILKTDIDQAKLDVLLSILSTWGIDVEVKPSRKSRPGKKQELFAETFGMWKDRDIDAKELRRQADNDFPLTFGLWKDRDIDARELRRQASGIDKRLKGYGK